MSAPEITNEARVVVNNRIIIKTKQKTMVMVCSMTSIVDEMIGQNIQ